MRASRDHGKDSKKECKYGEGAERREEEDLSTEREKEKERRAPAIVQPCIAILPLEVPGERVSSKSQSRERHGDASVRFGK